MTTHTTEEIADLDQEPAALQNDVLRFPDALSTAHETVTNAATISGPPIPPGIAPKDKRTRFLIQNPRVIGAATAIIALALIAIAVSRFPRRPDEQPQGIMGYATRLDKSTSPIPATESTAQRSDVYDGPAPFRSKDELKKNASAATNALQSPIAEGPMIARTAALTILVKDFSASRGALDAIVSRHRGYSANLTSDTPESGPRHFQASLRIPASEMIPALADLKSLGRTLTESQSGEEVTQQHADLVARIQNSRETEARLRAILQQRTGKIEDVLQVEEEIARVRGEIESMEAEQKVLEHRVSFATVDLQLTEEYKEHLNASPMSTSGRIRNAFIEGVRTASGTLLGLILFIEEFGPALLIWTAILGTPIYFLWRRRRKAQARP